MTHPRDVYNQSEEKGITRKIYKIGNNFYPHNFKDNNNETDKEGSKDRY